MSTRMEGEATARTRLREFALFMHSQKFVLSRSAPIQCYNPHLQFIFGLTMQRLYSLDVYIFHEFIIRIAAKYGHQQFLVDHIYIYLPVMIAFAAAVHYVLRAILLLCKKFYSSKHRLPTT
ncbi:MAG: hypothetical protein ACRCWR_12235 [Saezia sp.]